MPMDDILPEYGDQKIHDQSTVTHSMAILITYEFKFHEFQFIGKFLVNPFCHFYATLLYIII